MLPIRLLVGSSVKKQSCCFEDFIFRKTKRVSSHNCRTGVSLFKADTLLRFSAPNPAAKKNRLLKTEIVPLNMPNTLPSLQESFANTLSSGIPNAVAGQF